MRSKSWKLTLTILVLVNLIFLKNSFALTIAPAKIEFNAQPGEEIKFSIYVRNDRDVDEYSYSIVKGFTEDEGGNKIFLEDALQIKWVEIPGKVKTPPGEMIEVPVKIKIPNDAPPGGHFLAIGFGTQPVKGEAGQVSIGVNVLSLVYINVSGNRIDKISLSGVNFKKIYFGFPIIFMYKIKNEGNTYVRPMGDVEIRNIFGKLTYNLKVNEKEVQILPGKEKTLETTWKNNFAFGPYQAKFDIYYGLNNSQNLVSTHWFVVLPVKALVFAILVLIFLFVILPILIKKYNAWIIAKAMKNKQNE